MVCINSPVRHKQASSIERELAALFGCSVVEQAGATDPAGLTVSADFMDRVHDAADSLLSRHGPQEQRAFVEGLEPDTRLVLCMFIQDLELTATLAATAIRRAA